MIFDIIKNYEGECVIDSHGEHSYHDLRDQISEYRKLFSKKFHKHDRVVIYSDYNFHSISAFIALADLQINIIPIVKTTSTEFQEKTKVIDPHWIVSLNSSRDLKVDKCRSALPHESSYGQITNQGDTGVVLFSSGTTGKPKAMVQNLTRIISSIKIPRKQKTLRFIILLMFDHIGGLNTLLNCLINGSPFVIPENRSPSLVISLIDQYRVNVLPTTPTFLNLMMLDDNFHASKLESLKLVTYGTERMSEQLLERLNKNLPKVRLLQTFGTSETGILKTQSKSSNSLFFKIIDEEREFKIIDNELFLKSHTQVKGYVNQSSESFLEDGWYATGDIVETDDEGYIRIIGRKNKLINVGGLKVLPKEIEDVINSVEGVDESSVFSEPNNLVGNIVCVKVYTQLDNVKELKSLLKSVCRRNLDKYKIPVKWYFDKLDMTSRGKKA